MGDVPSGFCDELRSLIFQEARDAGVIGTGHREERDQSDMLGGVSQSESKQIFVIVQAESHHCGVPEVLVLVSVFPDHFQHRREGFLCAGLPDGERREEADASLGILQGCIQRAFLAQASGLAVSDDFEGVRANLGIGVREGAREKGERFRIERTRSVFLIFSRDLAEAPDCVESWESLFRRFNDGFELGDGISAIGKCPLRAEADALICVGQKFG